MNFNFVIEKLSWVKIKSSVFSFETSWMNLLIVALLSDADFLFPFEFPKLILNADNMYSLKNFV